LILGGADGRADIGIVAAARNIPVVLIIEYTLQTRLDMLRLTPGRTRQKLKTAIWLRATERARRNALRKAAGLQANGTPAFEAYGRSNRSPLLYFDTRLKEELFIGLPAAEAKATAVTRSKELRLAFSGRLDAVKGAEYLVPVLAALHRRGVTRATLDIYGDGGLRTSIAAQAQAAGLENHVRLHGPVPYEQVLVPAFRDTVDLFLCCHPQADPSCTYLETLGCGVPIAGFCNDAFKGVLALGGCGVGVPIGDVEGLAGTITCLDADRTRLAALTRGAASVASQHLFESVFAQRVAHLRAIAGL
jgi:colanic acid/amylovoran biosynthesis glycosyltransferase